MTIFFVLTLAFNPFSPSGMILTGLVLVLIFSRRIEKFFRRLDKWDRDGRK